VSRLPEERRERLEVRLLPRRFEEVVVALRTIDAQAEERARHADRELLLGSGCFFASS